MSNRRLILVVEDEDGISNFIAAILSSNDYQVVRAESGKEAVTLVASRSPDLVLLDLGLPDMDGLVVLRTIRSWSRVPVIVVSARGHEREKVEALDLGADDYVTKPFGTSELLARIRTALRHSQPGAGLEQPGEMRLAIGELLIDDEKRRVTLGGAEVHLTPIEYKIVLLLARHAGKVLTHAYLCKEIWGPYTNETQALRVNMANIRRKLEENPAEPRYIVTEVGVGYRMVDSI
ncbi:response regulator [Gorillibacterium timonense]|uniref:response regulator n=1 Tax=Gorillibacterium timonense TaxID=1689269 RepID=UPI00071DA4D6|nr:response regulator transcription factor [Gorillibacterium timonense]